MSARVGGMGMKWVECGVGGAVWRGRAECEVDGICWSGKSRVREDCGYRQNMFHHSPVTQ